MFLISDLHLDHANITKYCHRPFKSVFEMNRTLIRNWNRTIRKNDTVYFLGDLAFGRSSRKTSYWLRKLNGRIVFFRGNHDKSRRIRFRDKMFLNYKGHEFLLTHDPREVHHSWKGWVIHGHTHNNNPRYPLVNKRNKTINVSVELIDYKPIQIDDLLKLTE